MPRNTRNIDRKTTPATRGLQSTMPQSSSGSFPRIMPEHRESPRPSTVSEHQSSLEAHAKRLDRLGLKEDARIIVHAASAVTDLYQDGSLAPEFPVTPPSQQTPEVRTAAASKTPAPALKRTFHWVHNGLQPTLVQTSPTGDTLRVSFYVHRAVIQAIARLVQRKPDNPVFSVSSILRDIREHSHPRPESAPPPTHRTVRSSIAYLVQNHTVVEKPWHFDQSPFRVNGARSFQHPFFLQDEFLQDDLLQPIDPSEWDHVPGSPTNAPPPRVLDRDGQLLVPSSTPQHFPAQKLQQTAV